MAKFMVLGVDSEALTPIKITKVLTTESNVVPLTTPPSKWAYYELICRGYTEDGEDLIFAYDEPHNRKDGTLYIGYWNSGCL